MKSFRQTPETAQQAPESRGSGTFRGCWVFLAGGRVLHFRTFTFGHFLLVFRHFRTSRQKCFRAAQFNVLSTFGGVCRGCSKKDARAIQSRREGRSMLFINFRPKARKTSKKQLGPTPDSSKRSRPTPHLEQKAWAASPAPSKMPTPSRK